MFVDEFRRARKKILSVVIIDFLGSWLFSPKNVKSKKIKAYIILSLIIFVLMLLTFLSVQIPIEPVLVPSFIATMICSLCIFALHWCYEATLDRLDSTIEATTIAQNTQKRLADWVKASMSPRIQIFTSIAFASFTLVSLATMENIIGLPFDFGQAMVLAFFISFIGGGQGAFGAFIMPLLVKQIKQGDISDIEFYGVNPSQTPLFLALSWLYSAYALLLAILFSSVLILLFSLQADFGSANIWPPIFLIFIGYVMGAWTFLYPQYSMSKIIRRAKELSLKPIRNEISRIYRDYSEHGKGDYDRLKNLMELYETVSKSPNSVISIGSLWSYFWSLITPVIVAIVGW